MSTFKQYKKLETEKSRLIRQLKTIKKMIRGTYVQTHRKCGKPNCRCAKEVEGHPSYQISWTKDGRSRSKAIPKEDIPWIKEMTGNYKQWRTLRSKIRKLTDEERKLLDLEEEKLIQKTENLRNYFTKKPA
ncbi:hypothetical protein BMS3Bbin06_00497 [bacterium BMS3Bbin06]|nr:hypothetical protein BMS3Abin08_02111 [bacterium BMS3Abin08]GBE33981.1 hypothetical protein BMS3Bbin06_00497 [bacterium BMS3Bbin06]